MILIVGLGNPGQKYENTRHNIGFMAIDYFCKANSLELIENELLESEVAINNDYILAKPQTYMNLSGNAIKKIINHYKVNNILVIHDDLNLDIGVIKTKFAGSHGGHNGLKSIDQHITNDYFRLRIGIGRPDKKSSDSIIDYVLGLFDDGVMNNIHHIFSVTNGIIEAFINNETLIYIQNKYNTRVLCDF